jgi:hypothetical protein
MTLVVFTEVDFDEVTIAVRGTIILLLLENRQQQ